MMTRKHLVGLADALGTRLVQAGLGVHDAAAVGERVALDLVADGLVTRAFDSLRFRAAVEDAAYREALREGAAAIRV